jgi:CHAT domain-containing protein
VVKDYVHSLWQPQIKKASTASILYNLLIAPYVGMELKRLIIIPDDELNYLPFESLVDPNGNYLLQNIRVQYQYATSLLRKENINLEEHTTLSIAPFANISRGALSKLPASYNEIATLNGSRYFDTAATKNTFLNDVNKFQVVHLATHAEVNLKEGERSYIAFAGPKGDSSLLYAREIYDLNLDHTELVILSACETGAGNLVKGEGIMSLSRAFTYAGCPNIIASLWKADDVSTAYITKKLHHYLDEGISIDEALQKAKLDYLKDDTIHPRMKTPFYWSHLVYIGNVNSEKTSNKLLWILGGGVILLITAGLSFYFLKRRKIQA